MRIFTCTGHCSVRVLLLLLLFSFVGGGGGGGLVNFCILEVVTPDCP